MSREVKIKNIELKKLLEQRNKIVLEGRKQDEERQRLEEEIKKKGLDLQKIDGKATRIIQSKKLELSRDLDNKVWEDITGAGLKNGEIVITIADKFTEYAEAIRKQQAELDKKVSEEKAEDK